MHALLVRAVLHRFFKACMEITNLRNNLGDAFAVKVDDEAQDTVRAWVLRTDVDTHVHLVSNSPCGVCATSFANAFLIATAYSLSCAAAPA